MLFENLMYSWQLEKTIVKKGNPKNGGKTMT